MINKISNTTFAVWLLLPAIIIIIGLIFYPVIYNFNLSFYEKHSFLSIEKYVGFGNYTTLFSDPEFWYSLKNGLIYSISSIISQIVIGLICALYLNQKFRGVNLFRGLFLFPYLVPTIVVTILWKWLLNSSYGLVNYIMLSMGIINSPIVWLSESYIMTTLILVSTWQFFPFVLVTLLARLQTIPENLYSAAKIDGASTFSRFIHITLPQLKNVLLSVVLIRAIWMFTKFDTVWLLAGAEGVGKYIQTLPVYTYRKTFSYLQAGMGASVAVVMLLIIITGTIIYFYILHKTKQELIEAK